MATSSGVPILPAGIPSTIRFETSGSPAGKGVLGHGRPGQAHRHGVGADAVAAFLAGHHADQGLQSRLGRGALPVAGLAHLGGDGRNGDDHSRSLLVHGAQGALDHMKRPVEVHVDVIAPFPGRHFAHRLPRSHRARAVCHHVQPAKFSQHLFQRPGHRLGVGHIRPDGQAAGSQFPQLRQGPPGFVFAAAEKKSHPGAAPGELQAHGPSDAPAAPAHQHGLARKISFHRFNPVSNDESNPSTRGYFCLGGLACVHARWSMTRPIEHRAGRAVVSRRGEVNRREFKRRELKNQTV